MKKATVDLTDCKYLIDLHERIKDGMDFPEWYGKNWDAFWDMIHRETDCEFVSIKGSKTVAKELNDSIETMRRLLEKNKQYWRNRSPFDYEFID
jgi:RNAse (barnase) inhibitor barstar